MGFHTKVQNAFKEGLLIRPAHCSCCGKKGKPQGHHEDYNEPLSVVWLCGRCHRFRHTQIRQAEKAPPPIELLYESLVLRRQKRREVEAAKQRRAQKRAQALELREKIYPWLGIARDEEISSICQVSEQTVYLWRKARGLRMTRRLGRWDRIIPKEVYISRS